MGNNINYKQKPKPELSDIIRWWRKGWRGVFNEQLYIKICAVKSEMR